MKTIVRNRINNPIGMNGKVALGQDDPRRVSSVLAPIQPPPTADLVGRKYPGLVVMIPIRLLIIHGLISEIYGNVNSFSVPV